MPVIIVRSPAHPGADCDVAEVGIDGNARAPASRFRMAGVSGVAVHHTTASTGMPRPRGELRAPSRIANTYARPDLGTSDRDGDLRSCSTDVRYRTSRVRFAARRMPSSAALATARAPQMHTNPGVSATNTHARREKGTDGLGAGSDVASRAGAQTMHVFVWGAGDFGRIGHDADVAGRRQTALPRVDHVQPRQDRLEAGVR